MSQPATPTAAPIARLEARFNDIWRTRMAGLPILNDALRVEAVGFRPWRDGWLGVLVTPWFMGLLWLPADGKQPLGQPGEKITCSFPFGDYEFLVSDEDTIGAYLTCSLCSPLSSFSDHESARAAAVAVLEALLQPPATPEAPAVKATESGRTLSRRDLLFARFKDKT